MKCTPTPNDGSFVGFGLRTYMSQGTENAKRQLSLLGLFALVTGLGVSLGLVDFALRHVNIWGRLALLLTAFLYGGMLGAIGGQCLYGSRRVVFLGFVCSGTATACICVLALFMYIGQRVLLPL